MESVLNLFTVLETVALSRKPTFKLFHVFNSEFAICVTNDDKVYSYGVKNFIKKMKGEVKIKILSNKKIEQFFYNGECLFATSTEKLLFGGGSKEYGRLGDGIRSFITNSDIKQIARFDEIYIIDIKFGNCHCLALSASGLVYGWGDNQHHQFDSKKGLDAFLHPVLINNNSLFGIQERIKHIHCRKYTSILVSFDGLVHILNYKNLQLNFNIKGLNKVHKVFLGPDPQVYVIKENLIQNIANNKKFFEQRINTVKDSHYFENELIVTSEDGIHIFDELGQSPRFEQKNSFEYCLLTHQSTYSTINCENNEIKYINFELNQDFLIKSMKKISFKPEIYLEKYHNHQECEILKKVDVLKQFHKIFERRLKSFHLIGKFSQNLYSAICVFIDDKVYGIGLISLVFWVWVMKEMLKNTH